MAEETEVAARVEEPPRGAGGMRLIALIYAAFFTTLVVETGFHILLVIVVSISMLIYGPVIGGVVRRLMPPGDGTAGERPAGGS